MNRKQLACALIAGIISIILAHTHSFAAPTQLEDETKPKCDTAGYQSFIETRDSIQYSDDLLGQLALSKSFLLACPSRPEKGQLALHTARLALDTGQPAVALQWFETAKRTETVFHRQARMDYITTLILEGQPDKAWLLRDAEITRWLDALDETGFADVEIIRLRDGLIYKVTFNAVDPALRETLVWLAHPFGDGFPASISLSSDRTIIELTKLRDPVRAAGLQQLRLNRCHGRDTLMSEVTGIDESIANDTAMAAAERYLAQPDGVRLDYDKGKPIATCFLLDRLFVLPDPAKAVPVY